MKRWLTSLLGFALPSLAAAVAYDLPNNMPPGCTRSGSNYTCPGGTSLGYNDTVTISSPKPATVTVTGSFGTDNAQVNLGGNASDLTVIVQGTLTLGYQAKIKANITATAINDAGGGGVTITGNLKADGGNISLAYLTSVTGNLTAGGTGTITTGQNGTITGNVSAGSGKVTISENSTVTGNVSGSGAVTVVQKALVSGNVSAGSGAVDLGFQSRVNGNISTTGAITLGQESRVGGTVTGGAGNVAVGYATTVVGALTTSSGTISLDQNAVASACVKSTSSASITLGYQSSVHSVCCGASCTRSCVANNSTYAMPPACAGSTPAIGSFTISGTGSASSCTPQTLTITAKDGSGSTLTGYTGTVSLSTSTNFGTWSAGTGPAPSGTLLAPSNNGQATYTFAAADAGVVKLRLAHSLAQNVTVTVVDNAASGSSTNSAAINYRDNAFVWDEDLAGSIAGTSVAVAGRNHDMRVRLYKKDPTTGNCSVANDYTGSRNLKLWRTDTTSSWTAPSVVSPALTVPAARPGSNNLTLAFTAGVATFNLATTNVGKYAFNLDDDSGSFAATTVSGTSTELTVRPFTLAITGLALGGTNNPGGSAATDSVFGKAGAAFSATVTAYRWATGADANNDGEPDANVTLSQVSAGGVAAGFSASVTLTPLAASQTPAGGTLGALSNNVLTSFSSGVATASNLRYSEVGSFLLNTVDVVPSYLGTSGVDLDALVFNAVGAQQARVGRFIPAGFALSSPAITHRIDQSCTVSPSMASTFSYLDENFRVAFTLTAQNAAGATTRNYAGSFARLDLSVPANFKLAGRDASTMFKTTNSRLQPGASTGSWPAVGTASAGSVAVTLTAKALRATTADGPFDDADFGIAPADPDGATMVSLDLDTDSPLNGADSTRVGTIPLRFGRLRLQNGMAAANRPVNLALAAQYWDGSAYTTNTLDSCTRIAATNLSFGNLRKTLASSDAVMSNSPATLSAGVGRITLAKPASGNVGTLDVAIALGATAADASCLKDPPVSWTPPKAATAGANLAGLRGFWCGASTAKDPSARATWGLYRGSDGVLYQRENY